ncbi:MAG: cytochrome-c peroxidase [Bacteroidetes bacterium]|nr:MAG: cytochrome-c peroxidase [Bacteroidota bacterium]
MQTCLLFGLLIGCRESVSPIVVVKINPYLPSEFPPIDYPADNHFTSERWELGKKLFYDSVLSVDSSLSCASCHKSELSFSDDVAFSKGVKNRDGTRNAPSLANIAYHPYFTREGGVPTLEQQVLVPIQEHNEFDFNIVLAAERIALDSTYIAMSKSAYNRLPDYYVITRAIANFERELISNTSAFDQYHYEENLESLNQDETAGFELFYSKRTNCFECHGGSNFTNYSFENNGLYKEYPDIGRKRLTNLDSDESLFKVSSLRNVGITKPYMHDGSMATLKEVIEHYNKGGESHPNKSDFIKPLNLTKNEKMQLEAFLNSLTDYDFISNPKFKK